MPEAAPSPDRTGLRHRYWERIPMDEMTPREWEALCDGCGKCCLNKLEDEDTGEVELTRIACRLFNDTTCRCRHYETRHDYVPECIQLSPKTIDSHMYWLPQTCAYRLVWEGRDLYDWHPLISGDETSVARAGVSVRDMTISEEDVPNEDDWDDHIIEEPV